MRCPPYAVAHSDKAAASPCTGSVGDACVFTCDDGWQGGSIFQALECIYTTSLQLEWRIATQINKQESQTGSYIPHCTLDVPVLDCKMHWEPCSAACLTVPDKRHALLCQACLAVGPHDSRPPR